MPGLGSEVTTVTARLLLLLPQPFAAFTVTLPLVVLVVTVIDRPPLVLLEIPQPSGSVHVYDVAPVTAATL